MELINIKMQMLNLHTRKMHWQRICNHMLTRKLMICLRQVDKLKTKAATSGGTLDLLFEHFQAQSNMAKIYEK